MTKWEYLFVNASATRPKLMAEDLNALGEEGWEVISLTGIKKGITTDKIGILLKRPLPA